MRAGRTTGAPGTSSIARYTRAPAGYTIGCANPREWATGCKRLRTERSERSTSLTGEAAPRFGCPGVICVSSSSVQRSCECGRSRILICNMPRPSSRLSSLRPGAPVKHAPLSGCFGALGGSGGCAIEDPASLLVSADCHKPPACIWPSLSSSLGCRRAWMWLLAVGPPSAGGGMPRGECGRRYR